MYHFYSPYNLLLKKGIFEFFYLIIFSIIFYFIHLRNENGETTLIFSTIFPIFDEKINILIIIIFVINSFFYNIIIFKIIDDFSPNHFVIARVIENLGLLIVNIIIKGPDSEKYIIIRIIMHILMIFASLMYNEFLIINICGLGKNTQLFLDYRAEKEFNDIGVINDEDGNNYIELDEKVPKKDVEIEPYL